MPWATEGQPLNWIAGQPSKARRTLWPGPDQGDVSPVDHQFDDALWRARREGGQCVPCVDHARAGGGCVDVQDPAVPRRANELAPMRRFTVTSSRLSLALAPASCARCSVTRICAASKFPPGHEALVGGVARLADLALRHRHGLIGSRDLGLDLLPLGREPLQQERIVVDEAGDRIPRANPLAILDVPVLHTPLDQGRDRLHAVGGIRGDDAPQSGRGLNPWHIQEDQDREADGDADDPGQDGRRAGRPDRGQGREAMDMFRPRQHGFSPAARLCRARPRGRRHAHSHANPNGSGRRGPASGGGG